MQRIVSSSLTHFFDNERTLSKHYLRCVLVVLVNAPLTCSEDENSRMRISFQLLGSLDSQILGAGRANSSVSQNILIEDLIQPLSVVYRTQLVIEVSVAYFRYVEGISPQFSCLKVPWGI